MSLAGLAVLVVEDEPLFRRSVAESLGRLGCAVETSGTVVDAVAALERHSPAVVLLDAVLPDGGAEDVLDRLPGHPDTRVALITGNYDGDRWMRLAERCDVMLPKPISLASVNRVVEQLAQRGPRHDRLDAFITHFRLSPRERAILELAVDGANDKEIAHRCSCARGTIATYWQRIFKKTGQHSQRDVISSILRFGEDTVIRE
ncbi:MAG: response regulator transcription factor [Myxococcota bacterium]